MNATKYRAAISKLGMSQLRAARFFEKSHATAARWAKAGPPPEVAMMLNLMNALHVKPEWIDYWLGREKDETE